MRASDFLYNKNIQESKEEFEDSCSYLESPHGLKSQNVEADEAPMRSTPDLRRTQAFNQLSISALLIDKNDFDETISEEPAQYSAPDTSLHLQLSPSQPFLPPGNILPEQINDNEEGDVIETIEGVGAANEEQINNEERNDHEEEEECIVIFPIFSETIPQPDVDTSNDNWLAIDRLIAMDSFLMEFQFLNSISDQHRSAWKNIYTKVLRKLY